MVPLLNQYLCKEQKVNMKTVLVIFLVFHYALANSASFKRSPHEARLLAKRVLESVPLVDGYEQKDCLFVAFS
jgi:hypothetical protein